MDNAKYHNTVVEKVPTKSSTKKVMQTWLERHQIEYERSDLKRDLLRRIQAVNAKTLYKTDKIAKKYGHEVVRLPVAHCELAWAVVKDYCRKNNQLFTLKGIKDLIPNGLLQATPEMWKRFCDHVETVEDEYWEKDGLLNFHGIRHRDVRCGSLVYNWKWGETALDQAFTQVFPGFIRCNV